MKKIFLAFVLSLVFVNQTACISKMVEAAIPQKGKIEDKVKPIKSLAIIAFDSLLYVPAGLASHVGSLSAVNTLANTVNQESAEAKSLYLALRQELITKGYKVAPLEQVTSNELYQSIYGSKKGRIAEKTLQSDQQVHTVKNILMAANPEFLLNPAEVNQLKKALGVDALIATRLTYRSDDSGSINFGLSSRYLTATVTFYMFDGTQEKPIWFDYGFLGPRPEESIGRIYGHEDKAKISAQTVPVGTNAIKAFFK